MPLTTTQDEDLRTIHAYQGVTWRGIFEWLQPDPDDPEADPIPMDVTGYTARFDWLAKAGGTALVTVVSPDSDAGGIDIDPDTATFTVHLNAEQTALLKKDGNYELNAVSEDDPNEQQRISAGFANLILAGEPWPYPLVD